MIAQLLGLGVEPGGVLLVHTSFSRVGPVEAGPHGLIAALRAAVGTGGTLVMPSMSDDDDHPFDSQIALERLRADETVFLHPTGVDVECHEARASLAS